ncbi:MAG: DUF5776 domain-containing protein [Eubacterium sp.]
MKKELLTGLIVITLVISLSACGKTTHTQVETSETTVPVEQTTTIEEVITSEKNTTQTSSYKFKGNYIGETNPYDTLKIKKKNGTYKVTMFIQRLDTIHGTATLKDGCLFVQGTSTLNVEGSDELAKLSLKIEPNQNDITVVCTESDHPYIKVNDSFSFCKKIDSIELSNYDNNRTGSGYTLDLDHDGEKEEIRVWEKAVDTNSDNYTDDCTVYLSIDGVVLIEDKNDNGINLTVKIYEINNEYLLWIQETCAPNNYPGKYDGEFYSYQNGRLEMAYKDFKVSYSASVTDKIILDTHGAQFTSIGQVGWDMAYKLNGNNWEQMWEATLADYNPNISELTVTKKISVYKSPDFSSKKTTIKKGTVVGVRDIVEKKNGEYWIGITVEDGDSYYYKDSPDGDSNSSLYGIFKEAMSNFAG